MARHQIALIEDNEAEVMLWRECLKSVAISQDLVVLKDGEAALSFVEQERRGTEPLPSAIVLDLHLPKHDGLEILAAIRRTPALEHVSTLVISTTPSPEAWRQIRGFCVDYVEKPNTYAGYEQLAKTVCGLCESKFDVRA